MKGNDSRHSDTDLQTPSVFIFSVPVGVQKTTPPVSTLCALSEPPVTSVSFITGSDGSSATSRVSPLQEQGLFPIKVTNIGWKLSVFCPSHNQYSSYLRNCKIPKIWGAQTKAGMFWLSSTKVNIYQYCHNFWFWQKQIQISLFNTSVGLCKVYLCLWLIKT